MNFLKTLFTPSIRRRNTLALALVAVLVIGLAGVTLFDLSQIRPYSESIAIHTELQQYERAIAAQLAALDGDLERYILLRSPEYRDLVQSEMQELAAAVDNLRTDPDAELKSIVAAMQTLLTDLQIEVDTLLNSPDTLSTRDINQLIVTIYANLDEFQAQQQNLSGLLVGRIRFNAQAQIQTANRVQAITLTISIFVSFIAIAIAILNDLSLRNITRLTAAAESLSKGDLTQRAILKSQDELGVLANTFNNMATQLQSMVASLEQQVAERTKALATVAEISTMVTKIQEPFQMLATMVHLNQRKFNLYHSHVFAYNKETQELKIVACGWKEGDEHEGTHGTKIIHLSQEQSLVARAARTRQPVIVNDVHSDPGWLPNPLLPETRAEMAVPMIVGDELLGVLDVQAAHVDAFTPEDANIQMTLASQIATSYQSALAYEQAKQQAKTEALVNLISQKIQNATSLESVLQVAARELGRALGSKEARIILESPTTELKQKDRFNN